MSGVHTWVSPIGKFIEAYSKKTPDSGLRRVRMLEKLLEARNMMSYKGLEEFLVFSNKEID